MANRDENMLLRLQSTIESWSSEVTDAHEHLTRQIGETREQLGSLTRILAGRSQNGSTLIETFKELENLKKLLTQRDQEIETAQEEHVTLEREINMLQLDTDELRSRDRRQTALLESLNHELAEVLDRESVSADSLGQLRGEVQLLQERLADREAALGRASQAMNTLKDESAVLHHELTSLKAELESTQLALLRLH